MLKYKNENIINYVFNIKSPRFFLGIIFAVLSLVMNFIFINQVKTGVLFSILFIIAGTFDIKDTIIPDKVLIPIYLLWVAISSLCICYLSQMILNEDLFFIGTEKILLNMFICSILFFVLYMITLRPVLSVAAISFLLILLTVINYYITIFRGTELQPADILSARTALNVASQYKITVNAKLFYGCILAVLYLFFSFSLPKLKIKRKILARIVSFAASILMSIIFLSAYKPLSPYYWKTDGSVTNGYFLNFALQVRNAFVRKPKGYSIENIEKTASNIKTDTTPVTDKKDDYPDIIVIMNESFADLRYFGSELRTNQEVTPFIDSLKKNTIRGYTLSSICGGGTPNSEYEFLSGNSMMFLPIGSIVYQQYLNRPSYSIVTEMKNNHYECIALHPFLPSGWEREIAYPNLGFDESYFLDSFSTNSMSRGYISDKGMFEKMIDLYEEKKETQKNIFMFGVTMQNHGGYTYTGENYEQTIFLEGYSQEYPDVEQYLSLLHETDSAMEYLIHYFENIEEDVVIVFFGDHIPSLTYDFYEEMAGGAFDTLEIQQLYYTVPFFIWTNYDIEEETVELTSLNYLSNYMYKAAGLQLPEYNKVLSDIQGKIPALNVNGYYSLEKDTFLTYAEASGEEAELLNLYHQLVYNCLFDKNRNTILFPAIGSE